MTTSVVQLPTGTERAMKNLDRHINGLRINDIGAQSCKESCNAYSSLSRMSLVSRQQSPSPIPRFPEPSRSESLSIYAADASSPCRQNYNLSPVPTAQESLPHYTTRTCRAGTYVLDRESHTSDFGERMSFKIPEQGDTLTSSASMTASHMPASMTGLLSMTTTGANMNYSGSAGSGEENSHEFSKLISENTTCVNDYSKWLGSSEKSFFQGDSELNSLLNLYRTSGFKDTTSNAATKIDFNSEQDSQTYNYDSWKTAQYSDLVKQTKYLTNPATSADDNNSEYKPKFTPKPYVPRPKEEFNFETTDLGYRLRLSLQSNFLSNEFRSSSQPEPDEPPSPATVLRNIDDILMEHGLTKSPSKSAVKKACMSGTVAAHIGNMNVSQNNETTRASIGIIDLSERENGVPEKSTPTVGAGEGAGPVNIPSQTKLAGETEAKSSTTATATVPNNWSMNLSHNNEGTVKTASNPEHEAVRKFGSPVDFKVAGSSSKNYPKPSTSGNFGRYDYGKNTGPYSGDIGLTASLSPKYSFMDGKRFDNPLKTGTFSSGSGRYSSMDFTTRGDHYMPLDGKGLIGKTKSGEKSNLGPTFYFINSLGSSTDALGYSMFQERQRLRNINSFISTTPFFSSPVEPIHKSYVSQYSKTDTKSKYGDNFGRRLYSSPHLPSSYTPYGAEISTRTNWATNSGYRSHDSHLGKSLSVPGYGAYGNQSAHHNGSSVDVPRPGSSKNSVNTHANNSLGAGLQTTNENKSNKSGKTPQKKGSDFGLVNKAKKNPPSAKSSQKSVLLSGNKAKATSIGHKYSNTKSSQKADYDDFNVSKALCSLDSSFDFVKDLNRIWTQSVLGKLGEVPKEKPKTIPSKYHPYKPMAVDEPKPNTTAQGRGLYSPLLSARENQGHWSSDKPDQVSVFRDSSVHGVQSHLSLDNSFQAWDSKSKSNSPVRKEKSGGTKSAKHQRDSVSPPPKPILKSTSFKIGTARPQSAATSMSYNKPNQLVRGYSPMGSYSYAQPLLTAMPKKTDVKTKTSYRVSISTGKKGKRQ